MDSLAFVGRVLWEDHVRRINMEKRRMCHNECGIFFFFVQNFYDDFVGSVENKKSPLRTIEADLS